MYLVFFPLDVLPASATPAKPSRLLFEHYCAPERDNYLQSGGTGSTCENANERKSVVPPGLVC
jgi:hypothetical protein